MQHTRKSPVEIGIAYLDQLSKAGKLPEAIAAAYAAGDKEVVIADYYSRKKVTVGPGILDFVLPSDQLLVGVTNIDKGKIPVGEFVVVLGISVKYAFNSTSGGVGIEPASQNYANSNFVQAIPQDFRNSEFTFKNGNRKIVECLTENFIANDGSASSNQIGAAEENMLMLPQPKLVTPDKQLSVQFNVPANSLATVNDATHNHFVEFRMFGIRLIDRTKG